MVHGTSPSLYFLCLCLSLLGDSLSRFGSYNLAWKGIEPRELKFYVKKEHIGFEKVISSLDFSNWSSWVSAGCYWKIEVLDFSPLIKRRCSLCCPTALFFPLWNEVIIRRMQRNGEIFIFEKGFETYEEFSVCATDHLLRWILMKLVLLWVPAPSLVASVGSHFGGIALSFAPNAPKPLCFYHLAFYLLSLKNIICLFRKCCAACRILVLCCC